MEQKGTYEKLRELRSNGERVAVATVIRTRGSTPREVGAKMIVRASGELHGTVGGGCGEAEVWQGAMEVLKCQVPRIVTVDLTHEAGVADDAICGGKMDVFIEPWPGSR